MVNVLPDDAITALQSTVSGTLVTQPEDATNNHDHQIMADKRRNIASDAESAASSFNKDRWHTHVSSQIGSSSITGVLVAGTLTANNDLGTQF
jgi:hypothetical protein